ncbi:ester hydrolase C11orf54 homolog [Leptopilina heterotoma]|uniref:ester hydrolase C11orf54 homolog n=1 Tax=Leptopilina heterotoma TaxID=63436 RepID=UPI001CA83EF7|nr:ester hydrolase C11orf54 homolog [Leptopilina heterotoma]
MESLDPTKIKIEKKTLHVPPLEELKTVFSAALEKNFAEFSVEIVDSPDFQKPPFTLAASGLSGNPTILEVGGPAYLLPLVQKEKVYDIKNLAPHLNHGDKSFVIGAGAGPWPYANTNCEMMMNVVLNSPKSSESTKISLVNKNNGQCILKTLPGNETRFALLANLFLSHGQQGRVIRVFAKKRIGNYDFIATMQKALEKNYPDKLVGLGGTFLLKEGKAKQHVMQDFSQTPLKTEVDLNNWLKFYNMSAPLVAVGTFVSAETNLDLRVQHFHSFSQHGEGGHYHIDTTPEIVEYLGYFTPGKILYRVDQPPKASTFGKD